MILVTGGTGLVGSHLLWELVQQSEKRVKAIYRSLATIEKVRVLFTYKAKGDHHKAETLFAKITWFEADITKIPTLQLAFKDVTEIYHCAAYVSFDPKATEELYKINVEGTANMVNFSLAQGVLKFCFVSSIAALGKSLNGEPITAETEWDPNQKHSMYSITKFASEMEVWRGTQEGLSAVIVNPGIILGEGDYSTGSGRLFQKIDKGLRYTVSGATGFVDVIDVCQIMIKLMESPIINKRFIVVGKNEFFNQIFNLIAASLQKPKPHYTLKKWQLLLAHKIDWILGFLGLKKRSLSMTTINSSLDKRVYNNSQTIKELHFKYTSIAETIARTAAHYSSN